MAKQTAANVMFRVRTSRRDVPDQGCVTSKQRAELLAILPEHMLDGLTRDDVRFYLEMARRMGTIKRVAVFRVVGLADRPDAETVARRLARALGNHAADLALAIESYLATWPVAPKAHLEEHTEMAWIWPRLYKVSAILLSNSLYFRDKDFGDLAVAAVRLERAVHLVYDDLITKTRSDARKHWLHEMRFGVAKVRLALRAVLGSDSTTALSTQVQADLTLDDCHANIMG